jgi:acetate kinase
VAGILVVNAGSTSLKLSLVAEDESSVSVDALGAAPLDVLAVAHRVVHGGTRFREPVLLDQTVLAELAELSDLAPLHNGAALAAIAEARRELPRAPQVAVFDTAFHATIPEEAAAYAVPRRWAEEWGVRRYGFHGLSVQWAAERAGVARLVVCHLGGGCSVTAVRDGRSVDTSMGFSPLDGIPMATRSGALDPEIVLYLVRTGRLGLEEVEHALEHESGLLGLSGSSSRVEELERSTEPGAKLALDVFTHRVAAAVAAMATRLGGLDALAFTGGVGENSAFVRERVCEALRFLGVELDAPANARLVPDSDAEVSVEGSGVRVLVVRAREDVVAARATRRLVG